MKVALLIDTWFPFIGGGQINAFEISKLLAKKGIKIEIITRNNGSDKFKYPKNLTTIRLGSQVAAQNNLSRYVYLIKAYVYVYKREFDLVHAHAFLPGITARLLMVTKGIPAIFTVHGTSLGTKLNSFISRFIENFILTKILYTTQITVSRDFPKIKNINKKIIYIPNGVDEYFLKINRRVRRNQILCVARLHPQKNLINLIKAFKIILNDNPDYQLVIAGNGPQEKELIELIKRLKLNKKVNLIGEVRKQRLKFLYSSSKLFVLPSIYEGLPLSLLEALASKLPVVVSKVGDIPYIIKNLENGFLIDKPAQSNEIAVAIKRALDQKDLHIVVEKGQILVRKSLTWGKVAQKTLKIYEKITKTSS